MGATEQSLTSELQSPATLDLWKNPAVCEEDSYKHYATAWLFSVPPNLLCGILVP